MKIIISPAKKMALQDTFIECSKPIFLDRAMVIKEELCALTESELQELYGCNNAIAKLNFERLQNMKLDRLESPALLSYDGIQYKYMSPAIFEYGWFDYVQEKLVILSALYGALRPLDGVQAYRLEMQAKLQIGKYKNLYEYWGSDIFDRVFKNEDLIINLASAEYSKAIKKYITKNQRWIEISFGQIVNGKLIEKGVYVKMARGEMVSFMAEHNIQNVDEIKCFDRLGYHFEHSMSNDNKIVFIKK